MIIDDDARNIFALKAVLKSRGYDCLTATGAREGIQHLTLENNVAVVLLDMMMPEMDGYEAIREIRDGVFNEVPIVAVTAQAMMGDKDKCIAAGANAYISKPIDVDELMILIRQYVQ